MAETNIDAQTNITEKQIIDELTRRYEAKHNITLTDRERAVFQMVMNMVHDYFRWLPR